MTVVSADALTPWDGAAADLPLVPSGAVDARSAREQAFLAFYAEEYGALAAYCWRLTGNREVAADLAQESCARLFARWIGVREPRAYAYHVATNLARRQWRLQSRSAQTGYESHDGAVTEEQDAGIDVRVAVAALPRRLRDVVLLHYYADLPVTEVAEAVQRPVGTVKRQLAEARTALAKRLERCDV